MPTIILDSGALIALESRRSVITAILKRAVETDAAIQIPAAVLAQVWRDGVTTAPGLSTRCSSWGRYTRPSRCSRWGRAPRARRMKSVTAQPIRLFGDPVLRIPAAPVEVFDKELRVLVKDLTETMLEAPGSGLSAPQIGVSLRVFTYAIDDEVGYLINPDLDLSDEQQDGPEGCLSLPGILADTPRAQRAIAKGFNMHGEPMVTEGSGLLARCVQHETDHLDGVLFIDRLTTNERKKAMKAIRESEWFGANPPIVKINPHQFDRWY